MDEEPFCGCATSKLLIYIYLFGQKAANFQKPGFRQIQLDLYVISENEKCDHYSFPLSLFSSLLFSSPFLCSIDLVFRCRMRIIKNEHNEINDESYPGERQLQ